MKRWIAVLLLLAGTLSGKTQFVDFHELSLPGGDPRQKAGSQITIKAARPVVAAGIRAAQLNDLSGFLLIAGRDTFALLPDEHGEQEGYSNLVIFPLPVESLELFPGTVTGLVDLFLIPAEHAVIEVNPGPEQAAQTTEFGLPPMIDQRVWRAGLPDPQYERIFNRVRNVIVHHTASSNQAYDYTATVRSIYLYHTQVRGWSDIGYNYLVAPNGLVYKGRDPGPYPQDEVLGAHFCASNTGTLGISMIGDYQATPPPGLAMLAIEKLIAWKLDKDHLDPLGIQPHPLNPLLEVIAGHRNGCSTLCPGDQLYVLLPGLRNRVYQLMIHTGIDEVATDGDPGHRAAIYPNPVRDRLLIHSGEAVLGIRVLDTSGRNILQLVGPVQEIQVTDWQPGWYLVQVMTRQSEISKKILKIE
jgi:hypothetical protein